MGKRTAAPTEQPSLLLREAVKAAFHERFPEYPDLGKGFAENCQFTDCPKGAILKSFGEREKHFSMLLTGSAGIFIARAKRAICLDIGLPGDFLVDWESFLTGEPSEAEIRTLGKTTLARIALPRPGCEAPPGMEGLLLSASGFMFLDRQKRLVSVLTESPLARYRALRRRDPRLVREISAIVLASWLGITREHFCRIRADA